jgi:hypothetical protein
MRSRWTIAFLWAWALWSLGAAIEFLLGVPAGMAGLGLGLVAAVAIMTGPWSVLHRAGSSAPRQGPSQALPPQR